MNLHTAAVQWWGEKTKIVYSARNSCPFGSICFPFWFGLPACPTFTLLSPHLSLSLSPPVDVCMYIVSPSMQTWTIRAWRILRIHAIFQPTTCLLFYLNISRSRERERERESRTLAKFCIKLQTAARSGRGERTGRMGRQSETFTNGGIHYDFVCIVSKKKLVSSQKKFCKFPRLVFRLANFLLSKLCWVANMRTHLKCVGVIWDDNLLTERPLKVSIQREKARIIKRGEKGMK